MACVLVAFGGSRASADEPPGGWWLFPGHHSLHPPCMICPDDYCSKPMPCMAPFKYCGPDDYCCKPLPCVAPFKYCGPDDYCCKPLPAILPLCPTPLYTCGQPPTCNGTHHAAESKPSLQQEMPTENTMTPAVR